MTRNIMTRRDDAAPVVLAIAAAGLNSSVAVALGDRVLASRAHQQPHGQAEALLPMIDDAMREAGHVAAALDIVAVTVGPGSFTGIRVGLAAARGIALATGARLLGVSAFEAAAVAAEAPPGPLLVALESRREDLYVQLFDTAGDALGAAAAVLPADLADWIGQTLGRRPVALAGDAAGRAAAALAAWQPTILPPPAGPEAVWVVRAAGRRRGTGAPEAPPRPFYLRPPDVTPAGRRAAAGDPLA
jgi:tRNA threonylcarbamoyladenosine biosynthesis protein TsaB